MKAIKYRFIPQIGKKPKVRGIGVLCFDKEEAIFFENEAGWGDRALGSLKKAEVVLITSNGIRIKGFEFIGLDKQGKEKYRYIEWWCSFI